jgi:hypothetical protein
LCAAAAWRLSVDQGPKGGKEKILSDVFKNLRKELSLVFGNGWRGHMKRPVPHDLGVPALVSAQGCEAVRHGVLGPGPCRVQVGGCHYDEQSAIEHLRMAAPFAVEQFSAFCDVVIQEFK